MLAFKVTSDELKDIITRFIATNYKRENLIHRRKNVQRQISDETNHLNLFKKCEVEKLLYWEQRLENLNLRRLHDLIKIDFTNSNVLEIFQCIIYSITIDIKSPLSKFNRIKEFLTQLTRIGNPSSFGYVLSAVF